MRSKFYLLVISLFCKMGWKCCVPGCRSGYATFGSRRKGIQATTNSSRSEDEQRISFFAFPKSEAMLQLWLKAIPRAKFIPSKSSRVCSLHFDNDDIIATSQDTNSSRLNKRRKGDVNLQIFALKSSAIPRLFPNCPKYLSVKRKQSRSASSSTSARLQRENEELCKL